MHEKQRLEIERTIRPQRKGVEQVYLQKGDLTISKIVLPLKQKYVTALAAAGGKGHHVVCLIKYNEQVLPTQLVSTVASSSKNPELELSVPGTITLRDVYSDFTVTLEVYCLQAQEEILPHDIKYHIKKVHIYYTILYVVIVLFSAERKINTKKIEARFSFNSTSEGVPGRPTSRAFTYLRLNGLRRVFCSHN